MIKISLWGASGRMGKAVIDAINKEKQNFSLFLEINSKSDFDSKKNAIWNSDIIIDFSSKNSLEELHNIIQLKNTNTKFLICTTGLEAKHYDFLAKISQTNSIMHAPNTSLGNNFIASMAAQAAKTLKNYDVEILDLHHRYKKDSPSGTALMIGKKITDAKNIDFDNNIILDRYNNSKRKDSNEIGFSSIRAGGIYGENKVIFANEDEIITFGCNALSRSAFANGALFIANWLYDRNVIKLYKLEDLFNF